MKKHNEIKLTSVIVNFPLSPLMLKGYTAFITKKTASSDYNGNVSEYILIVMPVWGFSMTSNEYFLCPD